MKKKKVAKIIIIVLASIVAISIISIGALVLLICVQTEAPAKLETQKVIEKNLHYYLPSATIEKVEQSTKNDKKCINYYCKNYDVEFCICNFQERENVLFGGWLSRIDSNYQKKVFEKYQSEIEKIIDKYNVYYKTDDYGIEIRCNEEYHTKIKDFKEAENSLKAFEETYYLLKKYFAINEPRISASTDSGLGGNYCIDINLRNCYLDLIIKKQKDIDFNEKLDLQKYNIIQEYKCDELIFPGTEMYLEKYSKTKYIHKIVINDKEYNNENKTLKGEIVYDYENGHYSILMDNLNIQENKSYKKNNNPSKDGNIHTESVDIKNIWGYFTYKIDKNEFRIDLYSKNTEHPKYQFYKNNNKLKIQHYDKINDYNDALFESRTDLEGYISIDDFATLLNMKVDKITDDCIYFKTI